MVVKLPNVDAKRLLARRLFDAVISQVPLVGGPYAAILSVTHPPRLEQLHAEWQQNITEAVNKIEIILDDLVPVISLSAEATAIGVWISRTSEHGSRVPIAFTEIQTAFADAKKLELEDACGELEHTGLVTLTAAIGYRIARVRPTTSLFEIFDPVALETGDPRADAAELALFLLANDGVVSAEEIMRHGEGVGLLEKGVGMHPA